MSLICCYSEMLGQRAGLFTSMFKHYFMSRFMRGEDPNARKWEAGNKNTPFVMTTVMKFQKKQNDKKQKKSSKIENKMIIRAKQGIRA